MHALIILCIWALKQGKHSIYFLFLFFELESSRFNGFYWILLSENKGKWNNFHHQNSWEIHFLRCFFKLNSRIFSLMLYLRISELVSYKGLGDGDDYGDGSAKCKWSCKYRKAQMRYLDFYLHVKQIEHVILLLSLQHLFPTFLLVCTPSIMKAESLASL